MHRQGNATPKRKMSTGHRPTKLKVDVGEDLNASGLSNYSKTTTAKTRHKSLSRQFPQLKSMTPKGGAAKRSPSNFDRAKNVTATPKGTVKPSVFDFSGTPKHRHIIQKVQKTGWQKLKDKGRKDSKKTAELGDLKPLTPKHVQRFHSPRKTVAQTLQTDTFTHEVLTNSTIRHSATEGQRHDDVQTSSSLKGLVTQVKEIEEGDSELVYREHLFATFNALRFIKTMSKPSAEQIYVKRVTLPKRSGLRKTMIFDLDETLVHCIDDSLGTTPDVTLPVRLPSGDLINVRAKQAGINVRPYAKEILQAARADFEVIVFTASHQCYADVVLDYLDPHHELIEHRLYRDSCVVIDGCFVKDLRILNDRKLKDLTIVDNSALSFGMQLDNGVPIVSWYHDRGDTELLSLIEYLKTLLTVDDVRTVHRATFNLANFYEDFQAELQAEAEKRPRGFRRRRGL